MVPRPALDQVVETRAPLVVHQGDVRRARRPEEGTPADHVERVHVADAVDVGASVEQRPHGILLGPRRRPVQRRRVVAAFAGSTSSGSLLEHGADDVEPSVLSGGMKRGPARVRRVRSAGARERRIEAQESLRLVVVAAGAGGDERRAAGMLPPLDFGPEGSPAGESILARDGEERVREPRLRVGAAQFEQTGAGDSFQVVERGAFGKLCVGHDPSFHHRPASASLGLEVRVADCAQRPGWG